MVRIKGIRMESTSFLSGKCSHATVVGLHASFIQWLAKQEGNGQHHNVVAGLDDVQVQALRVKAVEKHDAGALMQRFLQLQSKRPDRDNE